MNDNDKFQMRDLMIVTTSYRVTPELEAEAMQFADRWGWQYEKRNDQSIDRLKNRYQTEELIVLSAAEARWVGPYTSFIFHPSMAVVRIKRLLKGETETLQEVTRLDRGDAFLDGTFGFGADAITASYLVGPYGRVVGLESEIRLAALAQHGLNHFPARFPELRHAMQRVHVKACDHLHYLKRCPDHTFDVVYFDPMFREEVPQSAHMTPLRDMANPHPLNKATVKEAIRVARKRVVLKEKIGSREFCRLGFQLYKKTSQSVSYGIIEVGNSV